LVHQLTLKPGVLYASIDLESSGGFSRLRNAVISLLQSVNEETEPVVLWSMQYERETPIRPTGITEFRGGIGLPPVFSNIVFEDENLDAVKQAWQKTSDAEGGEEFLQFRERDDQIDDDDVM
jgi:hypothetical protein